MQFAQGGAALRRCPHEESHVGFIHGLIEVHFIGAGFRQLEAISDDLAKGAMGQTASSLAEGIAEQTNDYFFRACCGALLEVVTGGGPRPATRPKETRP